jgi:hypothetical protein
MKKGGDKVSENGQVLTCHFPGCFLKLNLGNACVPDFEALRQKIGRPVNAKDLADHTICVRHAATAREMGVKTFSYSCSLRELERRAAEQLKAGSFFQNYAVPERVRDRRDERDRGRRRP